MPLFFISSFPLLLMSPISLELLDGVALQYLPHVHTFFNFRLMTQIQTYVVIDDMSTIHYCMYELKDEYISVSYL